MDKFVRTSSKEPSQVPKALASGQVDGFDGVVVRGSEARFILDGTQDMIVMPFQSRSMGTDGVFYLLIRHCDTSFAELAESCSDESQRENHIYRVVASLKFLANKRYDNETAASQFNCFPKNERELATLRDDFGIGSVKTMKTSILWHVKVIETFDPVKCISYAQASLVSKTPVAAGGLVKVLRPDSAHGPKDCRAFFRELGPRWVSFTFPSLADSASAASAPPACSAKPSSDESPEPKSSEPPMHALQHEGGPGCGDGGDDDDGEVELSQHSLGSIERELARQLDGQPSADDVEVCDGAAPPASDTVAKTQPEAATEIAASSEVGSVAPVAPDMVPETMPERAPHTFADNTFAESEPGKAEKMECMAVEKPTPKTDETAVGEPADTAGASSLEKDCQINKSNKSDEPSSPGPASSERRKPERTEADQQFSPEVHDDLSPEQPGLFEVSFSPYGPQPNLGFLGSDEDGAASDAGEGPTSAPHLSGADDRERNRKIVTSMAESSLFERDCFDIILEEEGEEKVCDILEAMNTDSYSTAFSGNEATSTSMNMLKQAWCEKLGLQFKPAPLTYMVEWNQHCINELLPMAQKDSTCLFVNIAAFFRDELKDTINFLLENPAMAVEILGPIISARQAMKLSAYCKTHDRECTIGPTDRHLAGTSCRPWSRKGVGMGAADPEIVFTLAWIGLRVHLADTEVLSENVKSQGSGGGPTSQEEPRPVQECGLGSLLLRFLGPYYYMETIMLSPLMLGDPFNREREFVKMVHKEKAAAVVSPMSRFCKRFFRMCQWSWKSSSVGIQGQLRTQGLWYMHLPFFQKSEYGVVDKEMLRELEWACSRPTRRFSLEEAGNDYEKGLTEMEYGFLDAYRKMFPGMAYALNQDPCSGHGAHATSDFKLFTLIHNFGLVWGDHCGRWLMPTEALAAQRFPILPVLPHHQPQLMLTSFHLQNPQRSGRHIFSQVGNSMHCGVMALIQLHSFSEIQHRQVPGLFMNIRLARTGICFVCY
eukprot:s125_g17.t1